MSQNSSKIDINLAYRIRNNKIKIISKVETVIKSTVAIRKRQIT